MEIETPKAPSSQVPLRSPSHTSTADKQKQDGPIGSPSTPERMKSVAAESLKIEAELDNLSDYDSAEEISEWECDALEKDQHNRS